LNLVANNLRAVRGFSGVVVQRGEGARFLSEER
jgi:hypothetical protein